MTLREPVTGELASLPQEVAPGRDLWPGIVSRLEPRAGRRAHWTWRVAVAATLVVVTSLVTVVVVRRSEQRTASVPAAAAPVSLEAASFGPNHPLNAAYDADRRQLLAQLGQRIATLPPAARDKLLANLAEMHRAAREINAALAREPGDPLLEELLMNTYQDELGVLASVNQLTSTSAAGAPVRQEKVRL